MERLRKSLDPMLSNVVSTGSWIRWAAPTDWNAGHRVNGRREEEMTVRDHLPRRCA